ncbi:MAG: hypothetical protein KIH65_003625 [Candidatus Uhrbacteria bacterium]|nr:hypothetical protein [Candidatus Uhrbacteria bacterium]
MNTRSSAVVDSTVTSEEELSLVLADTPISDDDINFLFNGAFDQEFSGEVTVQKPTIESSMNFDTFLASGIDPTTIGDEAAPLTLPSTLLLRNGEGS